MAKKSTLTTESSQLRNRKQDVKASVNPTQHANTPSTSNSPPSLTESGRTIISRQNYRRLKCDCLRRKQLFVDLTFPPTNASLFLDVNRNSDIVWKRPGDIFENPKLFVEGASPNDVTQGILGNCWFVSACSALTHNEDLLLRVIPNAADQEWGAEICSGSREHAYAGIFQFQFWRFGKWIEIIIDDLLPTKDGKLLFARSKTPNEFWSALLEKAFAKLYGCYENLVGGQLSDALQDVSGGVAETINVQKALSGSPQQNEFSFGAVVNGVGSGGAGNATPAPVDAVGKLFQMLRFAFNQQALIVAAIAAKSKEDVEKSLSCGLVKGHAYAVTAVRYIELDAVKEHHRHSARRFFTTVERKMMIRLQNPWGEKEWNGPWSDGSAEWEQVTASQKAELGITVDEDGEFWMPWDQFVKYFTDISVCQLFNTVASSSRLFTTWGNKQNSTKRQKMRQIIASPKRFSSSFSGNAPHYFEYIFYDSWTTNGVKSGAPRDRSGGCQNFPATFCFNPQYCFDVKDENSAEVMIALTQKEIIPEHSRQREPFVTIGVHVMCVEYNREFRIHQPINAVATSDYASSRSVYLHLNNLSVGRYILMPTTYAPREQAEFMMRLYSRGQIKPRPLLRDSPRPCPFSCANVCCVTRIKIADANLRILNDVNVYCCVIGGHERIKSHTLRASSGKVRFNEMFLFHRNSLRQSYRFEIWEDNRKQRNDKKLAFCSLNILTDNDSVTCALDMCDNSTSKTIVGKLTLEVCSYDDPMYL